MKNTNTQTLQTSDRATHTDGSPSATKVSTIKRETRHAPREIMPQTPEQVFEGLQALYG